MLLEEISFVFALAIKRSLWFFSRISRNTLW